MQQPSLGSTGLDVVGCNLTWTWEGGWRLRVWGRLSGSEQWYSATLDEGAEPEVATLHDVLRSVVEFYGVLDDGDGAPF